MNIIKRILLLIILIITFLIGVLIKDDKIYYISIGDGLSRGINYNEYESKGYSDYIKEYLEKNKKLKFYTKEFSNKDDRTTDLINKIIDNEEIIINNKKLNIQNAISKSKLITLSIGFNEILYKYKNNINNSYMYDYIDSYIKDIDKLLKLIRKYNNKKIYFIGYYNPTNDKELDKYIIYSNDKLINVCNKNKIEYIDTYNIFKNNKHLIYNINNFYPNEDGYKLISNEIVNKLKNSVNNS